MQEHFPTCLANTFNVCLYLQWNQQVHRPSDYKQNQSGSQMPEMHLKIRNLDACLLCKMCSGFFWKIFKPSLDLGIGILV
jgi:hypothetical protein